MSNVYRTLLCTAANVDTIRTVYASSVAMSAEFTTNPEAAPPPTHYLSAGQLDSSVVASMVSSGLFVEVSPDTWPTVTARNGLVRVEYVE